ncbi:MAG: NifU family protein [Holosporaceae bacterium]|jgi:Fe-S cluster biogenesis protein NfuA|nr:NifU family protein [Holosporaceae bacterium]
MSFCPELLQKITEIIDLHVRPSLNVDGGDIDIVSLDGKVLSVKLKGACNGCPCAANTLKYNVQDTLNKMLLEDLIVVSV